MRTRRYWSLLLLVAVACSSKPSASTSSAPVVTTSSPRDPDLASVPQTLRDAREGMLGESVAHLLTKEHLLRKPIDDKLSQAAFPKYLEQLDGSKLFLLKEQVDELSAYARDMDDELETGDFLLARYGSALVARRRKAVAKMVDTLLASPFDFTQKETFETDPEKREFCTSEEELLGRWRAFLKLQVLERVEQLEQIAEARKKAEEAKANPPKDAGKKDGKAGAKGGKPTAEKDKASDNGKTEELDPAAKREEIPATFEGREEKARKELATRFQTRFTRWADIESLEPAEQFLNAVASVYDPHTVYMAPSESENFDISITGKLEGIGAALSEEDHYIVVKEIIPGGASWQQGKLEAGDLILAVAQAGADPVDVTDMPIDKVVTMIRGKKGTVVTLTVKKADGHVESISITRDVVQIEANYARGALLKPNGSQSQVGYIYLPGFYGELKSKRAPRGADRNATDDVRMLLEGFKKRGVTSVILDLRGNGGGLLEHARDISGLFIETGPIVAARNFDGKMDVLIDEPDEATEVTFGGDLVVMVDRFSASASEIVAAALQDYERAVIVGTGPTHGKGTVQAVVELDRFQAIPPKRAQESLGVFKITIEQFFRVNGESTQWRGVVPDVVLPDPSSWVDSGERTLFNSIPWTSIDALRFTKVPHKWSAGAIAAQSKSRVAANPLFGKVESFGKVLTTQRKKTVMPVDLEGYRSLRKQEKDALEAEDPKLAKASARFEVTMVDGNGVNQNLAPDDKLAKKMNEWRDNLARDPWVEESLYVLADMAKAK